MHKDPPLNLAGVLQRKALQYVWHQFGCRSSLERILMLVLTSLILVRVFPLSFGFALWLLAFEELIHPLTALSFCPAGYHATVLTSMVLVGKQLRRRLPIHAAGCTGLHVTSSKRQV